MNAVRARQVMAWVGEQMSLAAIGEYCAVMTRADENSAETRVVAGTIEEFGRAQVREAKNVLGIVDDKDGSALAGGPATAGLATADGGGKEGE